MPTMRYGVPSGLLLGLSPTVRMALVTTPGATGMTYDGCELQTAAPPVAGGGGGTAPDDGSKSTPTVARPFWVILSATCVTSTTLMLAATGSLSQVAIVPAPS